MHHQVSLDVDVYSACCLQKVGNFLGWNGFLLPCFTTQSVYLLIFAILIRLLMTSRARSRLPCFSARRLWTKDMFVSRLMPPPNVRRRSTPPRKFLCTFRGAIGGGILSRSLLPDLLRWRLDEPRLSFDWYEPRRLGPPLLLLLRLLSRPRRLKSWIYFR